MNDKKLLVLIDCEESGTVTNQFRAKGHEAYSCDLWPTSGEYPEYHIQGDAIEALYSRKWDLVIAHPPCTRLANSGVRWLAERNLWNELKEAIKFFRNFIDYGLKGNKIRIENPIPHKYAINGIDGLPGIGMYSQIIHPWQFGHPEQKSTCLWNFNLENIIPENIVTGREQKIWKMSPGPERSKLRSKTYEGIAKAFANQLT